MPVSSRWAPDLLRPGVQRRTATTIAAVCVAATAFLGWKFAHQTHAGWLDTAVDSRVKASLRSYKPPMLLLARLGRTVPVAVMSAALAAACLATRRWRGTVLSAIAAPGAGVVTEYVLKPWVGRTLGGVISFPSGHSTGTFALAIACTVLLLGPGHPHWRAAVRVSLAAIAMALAAAVATAMIGLGMHYFTDTVGGTAVGIGTVLLATLAIDQLWQAPRQSQPRAPSDPAVAVAP